MFCNINVLLYKCKKIFKYINEKIAILSVRFKDFPKRTTLKNLIILICKFSRMKCKRFISSLPLGGHWVNININIYLNISILITSFISFTIVMREHFNLH